MFVTEMAAYFTRNMTTATSNRHVTIISSGKYNYILPQCKGTV